EDMEEIVDLQMQEITQRLDEHDLSVELLPPAREWLAKQGYDPAFGARPLKRALQKHLESPLSVRLLRGDFNPGDKIRVDANDETGLEFILEPSPDVADKDSNLVTAEQTVDTPSSTG
ncbi:MAG: hypothetical protein MK000_08140, partial [Anaerolineales bacterium]|nr:hypothetical protein [Anaerolineales bacterium]